MKYKDKILEKPRCFAERTEECIALDHKECKNCVFYKSRDRAKREYIEHRDIAMEHNVDRKIDKFFMNL